MAKKKKNKNKYTTAAWTLVRSVDKVTRDIFTKAFRGLFR